jgi:hypothetical protein
MAEKAQTQVKAKGPAIASSSGSSLQRKCACGTHTLGDQCDSCKGKGGMLQRKASSHDDPSGVPPIVREVLRSPGQPLDSATRVFFEPRFGHDFSQVRVHADSRAGDSASAVGALAYTVGANVVLASGQYKPHTATGRQLLAHELTHVAQQRSHEPKLHEHLIIGSPDDAFEQEADRFAQHAAVASVKRVGSVSSTRGMSLQRLCEPVPGGSTFEWKVDYDGCSDPEGFRGKLVDLFLNRDNPAGGENTAFAERKSSLLSDKACDRHDECYQTCHHGDQTQKDKCDTRLMEDMIDTCFEAEKDSKKCFRWAKIYRWLLKNYGEAPYAKRQQEVCECNQTMQLAVPEKPKRTGFETLEKPK